MVQSHAIISHDLTKKFRALALRHALSSKAKEGALVIIDDLAAKEPKTAGLRGQFGKLGIENALMIGGAELEGNFKMAARNIPNIDVLPVQGINVYDILSPQDVGSVEGRDRCS